MSHEQKLSRRDCLRGLGAGLVPAVATGQSVTGGRIPGTAESQDRGLRRAWFKMRQNGDIDFILDFNGQAPTDVTGAVSSSAGRVIGQSLSGIGWTDSYTQDEIDLNEELEGNLDETLSQYDPGDNAYSVLDSIPDESHAVQGRIAGAVDLPNNDGYENEAFTRRIIEVPAISYNGSVNPVSEDVYSQIQLINGYVYGFRRDRPDAEIIEPDGYRGQWRRFWSESPSAAVGNPNPGAGELIPSFQHRPHPALPMLKSSAGVRSTGFTSLGNWAASRETIIEHAHNVADLAAEEIAAAMSAIAPIPTELLDLRSWGKYFKRSLAAPLSGAVIGKVSGSGPGSVSRWYNYGSELATGIEMLGLARDAQNGLANNRDELRDEYESATDFGNVFLDFYARRMKESTTSSPATSELVGLADLQRAQIDALATIPASEKDRLQAAFTTLRELMNAQQGAASQLEAHLDGVAGAPSPADRQKARNFRSYIGGMSAVVGKELDILTKMGTDMTQIDLLYPTEALTGQEFTIRAVDPTAVDDSIDRSDVSAVDADEPWTPEGNLEYEWILEDEFGNELEVDTDSGSSVHEIRHEPAERGELSVKLRVRRDLGNVSDTLTVEGDEPIVVDGVVARARLPKDGFTPGSTKTLDPRLVEPGDPEAVKRYVWEIYPNVNATSIEELAERDVEPAERLEGTDPTEITEDVDTYTFEEEGRYTVLLRVTGEMGSESATVGQVVAGDPILPEISVDYDPPLRTTDTVTLDGTDSRPGGNSEIIEYRWEIREQDFSPVEQRSGPELTSLEYSFPRAGTYRVKLELTVETAAGEELTAAKVRELSVTQTPEQRFRLGMFRQRPQQDRVYADQQVIVQAAPPSDLMPAEETPPEDWEWQLSGSGEAEIVKTTVETLYHLDGFPNPTVPTAYIEFGDPGRYTAEAIIRYEGKEGSGRLTLEVDPSADRFTEPQDLNGDGLYRDLNGNGEVDFDDVVTLRERLDVGPRAVDDRFNFAQDPGGDVGEQDIEALLEYIVEEET